jgi:hypothetical protein
MRATSADFQSPCTSIVWSGAKARSWRRSARIAANVAGESARRRHAFVSATKTRAQCGLPSSSPANLRSTTQPTLAPAAAALDASGSAWITSPIAERRTSRSFTTV